MKTRAQLEADLAYFSAQVRAARACPELYAPHELGHYQDLANAAAAALQDECDGNALLIGPEVQRVLRAVLERHLKQQQRTVGHAG